MAKTFTLCGKDIVFNDDMERYQEIRSKFLALSITTVENVQKFYTRMNSLDQVFSNLESHGLYAINDAYKIAVNIAIEYGKYECTVDYLKDLSNYEIEDAWRDNIDEAKFQYDEINRYVDNENNRREYRKDSRFQVVGGGFGLTGAATGMLAAGVFNFATGLAHSLFNGIGNVRTRSKANAAKEWLYAQPEILVTIENGISDAIMSVCTLLSNQVLDLRPITSKYTHEQAANIRSNLMDGKLPDKAIIDVFPDLIAASPFDQELYKCSAIRIISESDKEVLDQITKYLDVYGERAQVFVLLNKYKLKETPTNIELLYAVKSGDINAQKKLGILLATGNHPHKDDCEDYFRLALASGDDESKIFLMQRLLFTENLFDKWSEEEFAARKAEGLQLLKSILKKNIKPLLALDTNNIKEILPLCISGAMQEINFTAYLQIMHALKERGDNEATSIIQSLERYGITDIASNESMYAISQLISAGGISSTIKIGSELTEQQNLVESNKWLDKAAQAGNKTARNLKIFTNVDVNNITPESKDMLKALLINIDSSEVAALPLPIQDKILNLLVTGSIGDVFYEKYITLLTQLKTQNRDQNRAYTLLKDANMVDLQNKETWHNLLSLLVEAYSTSQWPIEVPIGSKLDKEALQQYILTLFQKGQQEQWDEIDFEYASFLLKDDIKREEGLKLFLDKRSSWNERVIQYLDNTFCISDLATFMLIYEDTKFVSYIVEYLKIRSMATPPNYMASSLLGLYYISHNREEAWKYLQIIVDNLSLLDFKTIKLASIAILSDDNLSESLTPDDEYGIKTATFCVSCITLFRENNMLDNVQTALEFATKFTHNQGLYNNAYSFIKDRAKIFNKDKYTLIELIYYRFVYQINDPDIDYESENRRFTEISHDIASNLAQESDSIATPWLFCMLKVFAYGGIAKPNWKTAQEFCRILLHRELSSTEKFIALMTSSFMYYYGGNGLKKDKENALQLETEAMKHGDVNAYKDKLQNIFQRLSKGKKIDAIDIIDASKEKDNISPGIDETEAAQQTELQTNPITSPKAPPSTNKSKEHPMVNDTQTTPSMNGPEPPVDNNDESDKKSGKWGCLTWIFFAVIIIKVLVWLLK